MKKTVFFLMIFLAPVFLLSLNGAAADRGIRIVAKNGRSMRLYDDYHAVVIGVSNYQYWPKLPNAAKDAAEVADQLKRMGVHVKLVLNPTYREMKTVLADMVYDIGRKENRGLLFFYAGHGETEALADGAKMGYIIPRDCPVLKHDPRGFAAHAVSMGDIESASLKIRCKHVLMLFDSCFSGALFSLVRAVPDDITEKSLLPVRQYITAGTEEESVPDKSTFKRCLMIGLGGSADLTGDGYITGSELGMYLADKVVNYTHRQQHPQYGKINNPELDRGDFVFALKRSEPKKIVAPAKTPSVVQASAKPQIDLDALLEKVRQNQAAKRKAREALLARVKELKVDLEKYNQILEAKPDETLELAAWELLAMKYPEWTQNVKSGDTTQLVRNVLAQETDGSLKKIFEPGPGKGYVGSPQNLSVNKPSASIAVKPGETTSDGRFIANSDGTVLDTKTKLMWASSDVDVSGSRHSHAEECCTSYRGGGYTDWRMPTLDELEGLYDEKLTNEHGSHITKLINVGADYIWADNNSWVGRGHSVLKQVPRLLPRLVLIVGMPITAQGRCRCELRIEHYGYLMI